MAEKEKPKEELGYEVVQIPTQTAPAIKTPEGEVISVEQGVALCLNYLKKLEKVWGK